MTEKTFLQCARSRIQFDAHCEPLGLKPRVVQLAEIYKQRLEG